MKLLRAAGEHAQAARVIVDEDGSTANMRHHGAGNGVVLMKALADRLELDGSHGTGTTVGMELHSPVLVAG
jgi:hypothetical protein